MAKEAKVAAAGTSALSYEDQRLLVDARHAQTKQKYYAARTAAKTEDERVALKTEFEPVEKAYLAERARLHNEQMLSAIESGQVANGLRLVNLKDPNEPGTTVLFYPEEIPAVTEFVKGILAARNK